MIATLCDVCQRRINGEPIELVVPGAPHLYGRRYHLCGPRCISTFGASLGEVNT